MRKSPKKRRCFKFRLRAGTHRAGNRVWTEGDIIETPFPLDKAFPNKFDRVMGEAATPETTSPITPPEDVEEEDVEETPKPPKSRKPRAKAKAKAKTKAKAKARRRETSG